LEKATEVGVSEIVPVISARSEKKSLNQERCEKILKEAAEQSGRAFIPRLHPVTSFDRAVSKVRELGTKTYFTSLSEKENMIRKLSYMLAAIRRRALKPTMQIKSIDDVKKVLSSKSKTKDDVLNCQKFILEKGINDLISILKSVNDIKKLREIARQFEDIERKKAIFEKT